MKSWIVRGLVLVLGLTILTPIVLRVFFFSLYTVPSGSMEPGIRTGRHVFVSKRSHAARGEVTVFRYPERPEQEFIKRVIALPGETVEVTDGKIQIDGWSVPECAVGPYAYADLDGTKHSGELAVEFLGAESYLVFFDSASTTTGVREGPWIVKAGELWVMGDNRFNSHDSRQWFGGAGGGVPFDLLEGKAIAGDTTTLESGSPAAAAIAACLAKRPAVTEPPRRGGR